MKFILKHSKAVIVFFAVVTALCTFASLFVGVNYNLMDYLPDESPSTIALNKMNEEYDTGVPNARIMIRNVTVPEALEYKDKFEAIDGVDEVSWLDDAEDIKQPLEFMKKKTVEEYYKDGNALFTLTINEDKQIAAVDRVRETVGKNGALSGNAVNTVTAAELTSKEVNKIMVLAVVLVFIILLLTTKSYFEPVLFLCTIGVAIMINRGTNLFFGEISFVTNAAGSILQLAVSMDYSIFLLHSFQSCRERHDNANDAMNEALKTSFASVMSSGLTTVMGFAALILMKFKIGPDMGWIMAKAIAISLITVLLFMPSATLLTYKLIDKSQHKSLLPDFTNMSKLVDRLKNPVIILFAFLLIPCYFAQQSNSFTYGQSGIYGEGTTLGDDTAEVERIFGKSNLMVLMAPKGTYSKEEKLSGELLQDDRITSVLSYSQTVGNQIPDEMVPGDTLKQLVGNNYTRLVITADAPTEGDSSFKLVDDVKKTALKYYKEDEYLLVGETVNSYDLMNVVTDDNVKVNFLAILSIFLILIINFKGFVLPVILVLVIELSIWINLTVPYFENERLFYIGYLIISSIQLGATVDYAILMANTYFANRKTMLPHHAVRTTLSETIVSILTSALILTSAGFMLGFISSNGVISQLGILVGRGAVLSGILVLFALPSLLVMFDKVIEKTTHGVKFYKGDGLK